MAEPLKREKAGRLPGFPRRSPKEASTQARSVAKSGVPWKGRSSGPLSRAASRP